MSTFEMQKQIGLDKFRQNLWMHQAAQEIEENYGDKIEAVGKTITKFGENELVGTSEATIMSLPSAVLSETHVATNLITQVSSSSASPKILLVTGSVADGVFTYVSQEITLTGQTAAPLTTALARVQRVYNSGSAVLVGNVYVSQTDTLTAGVPDTSAKIHAIAPLAENQTLKAASTTANGEYMLISKIYASINDKTLAAAVVRLSIRNAGGVFRTQTKRAINSQGPSLEFACEPFLIVPPNSDIKMSAEADGASTPVSTGYAGILVNAYA